jgi:alkanesulfonate monooxygenase SsuD/methylene tetrahydromethanopterin reductase-like flavin-dependent oxidoreductase (luciferase family)
VRAGELIDSILSKSIVPGLPGARGGFGTQEQKRGATARNNKSWGTMKLGLFLIPIHPRGRNYAETLREDREAVILADKLGFAEAFCGEHLTDSVENIPSSLMFMSSLVGATKNITLGTAVVNLPHSHPALVASYAAMLDNMLEGRFIFGVGAGIIASDAEVVGVLGQDRNAMFLEAIDHIVKIWKGSAPYKLEGKYWTITTEKTQAPDLGLGALVPTYQKPHPPILGTAADPDSKTITSIGKRGWLAGSSGMLHQNWLPNHWRNYVEGCKEGGFEARREDWRVGRLVFVAEDDKVAKSYGITSPDSPYRFHLEFLADKFRRGKRSLRSFRGDDSVTDESLTLDDIVSNIVIAGSVNSVIDQILALHELVGDFGTLLYVSENWTDAQLSRKSMELLAEKVMPAVNKAIGKPAHAKAESVTA